MEGGKSAGEKERLAGRVVKGNVQSLSSGI